MGEILLFFILDRPPEYSQCFIHNEQKALTLTGALQAHSNPDRIHIYLETPETENAATNEGRRELLMALYRKFATTNQGRQNLYRDNKCVKRALG